MAKDAIRLFVKIYLTFLFEMTGHLCTIYDIISDDAQIKCQPSSGRYFVSVLGGYCMKYVEVFVRLHAFLLDWQLFIII